MIGRENFSALVVSRDSKRCNGIAGPPLCVYTQVIFGERVLRSLSSPTARRIGLRSRIPRLCLIIFYDEYLRRDNVCCATPHSFRYVG